MQMHIYLLFTPSVRLGTQECPIETVTMQSVTSFPKNSLKLQLLASIGQLLTGIRFSVVSGEGDISTDAAEHQKWSINFWALSVGCQPLFALHIFSRYQGLKLSCCSPPSSFHHGCTITTGRRFDQGTSWKGCCS